ncbi:NifB/NifX family molybdenum-iron cluster-binding protein [Pseudaeromonas paramecii]|uniref:Dinitrogenase iron-molybdenum cofactor biosynthesis domain-containing protein n=1 Tax=Pseudaeromonas paramecii TaxID=2138166 RepID=A0ABP8Q6R2_9GAMM
MHPHLESQVYWRLIALAQEVPELPQTSLFDWLADVLDGPLTSAQLAKLSLAVLQRKLPAELASLSAERWQTLLQILQGALPAHLDPKPQPAAPGSLRAAFASSDGLSVNGHFGNCTLFFIYQLDGQSQTLVDIRRYQQQESMEANEARASLLDGCHLLFCEAIGGPAAARVIRHGIHPIKVKQDRDIQSQLSQLNVLMSGTLPPWLAKVLGRKSDLSVRYAEDDGL